MNTKINLHHRANKLQTYLRRVTVFHPCLLFISFCCFTAIHLQAQQVQMRLDTLISKYEALNWSGVLYVGDDKKITYQKAFGFADREHERAMQVNTVFKTESVGKMFTSVRILQLISKGKLKLTSTVAELLPGWEIPHAEKIHIEHLLTHKSGLSSPWEHPEFQFGKIYSKEEMKRLIETAPLAFKVPGEKRYYSNSAYILLEEVIVKFDKQSFESSIRKNIFKPAGMQHTRFLNDSVLPANAAVPYYQVSTSRFAKDDTRYGDGKASGAGGWMSTAHDLYLFAKAYLNEKLLPAKWMQVQISNNHTLTETAPDGRLGFQVLSGAPKNWFVIGHNGGGKGFSVDVYFNFHTKHIVVFCSNSYGTGYALTRKVFNVLSNQPYPEPAAASRIKLADWLLQKNGTESISAEVLQALEIRDATEFLFFSVFDQLTMLQEHVAAGIVMKACREKYAANIDCWVKSGENALALHDAGRAKEFFNEALRLAEASKNDDIKKIIHQKLSAF
jgi:D-alanyl-D-alanine carboxypeptidase